MHQLPQSILDHLSKSKINPVDVAWLQVTTAGQIIHTGGPLSAFKLATSRIGGDITRNPALAHLLPVKSATVLPAIQLSPRIHADIHLFPDDEWAWIVFVNVTKKTARHQRTQQHRNDAALRQHQDSKRLK
jgi:hypothetical protein